MNTITSIIARVLRRVMCILHPGIKHALRCGCKSVYDAIEELWNAVIETIDVVNKNADEMEQFTAKLAEWANEQETKIQEAIDGANQDMTSLTIGYNQLGGDVKRMLTNILLSQLSEEVTARLLTDEMKTKIGSLKNYVLPKATQNTLGGVMVGTGVFVDSTGRLSTTLDKLGMKVENGKLKFQLIEDGKYKTYSISVDETEDAPQPEVGIVVYTSSGDVERDSYGNPTGEYVINNPMRRIVNAGQVNGFVAQTPYFALLIPENARLASLTMNGAFGEIDLLAENDFVPTEDYYVGGVAYHVYLYHMPVASEENVVRYEYVVNNI